MALTNDEVLAGLAELITDETGISADEVAMEKSFTDDLDIDAPGILLRLAGQPDRALHPVEGFRKSVQQIEE